MSKMHQLAGVVRPKTNVRERAEQQAEAFSDAQRNAARILANELHRLNQAVMEAVEAGLSVELVRSSRHHGGGGSWGDLMVPRFSALVPRGLERSETPQPA